MMRLRRRRPEPMPAEFDELAVYNAEKARGLVHTPKCDEQMHLLQEQFYRWREVHPHWTSRRGRRR